MEAFLSAPKLNALENIYGTEVRNRVAILPNAKQYHPLHAMINTVINEYIDFYLSYLKDITQLINIDKMAEAVERYQAEQSPDYSLVF